MSRIDPFIEWLKEKILSNPQEPPANTWEQVAESLDLEESWEGINDDLDLEMVWEKVDSRLHRLGYMQFFERLGHAVSGLAAILLLLGLWWQGPGMDNQLWPQGQTSPQLSLAEEQGIVEVKEKAANPDLSISEEKAELQGKEKVFGEGGKQPGIKGRKRTVKGSGEGVASSLKRGSNGSEVETAEDKEETVKDKSGILRRQHSRFEIVGSPLGKKQRTPVVDSIILVADGTSPVQGFFRPDEALSLLKGKRFMEDSLPKWLMPELIAVDTFPFLPDYYQEEKVDFTYHFPKMVAGLGSAAKLSWLMNNKTLTAIEKTSLITAVPAVHTDLFLTYGLRLQEQYMLQADGYLFDWSGQRYREYRNGTYGEVEDKLLYRSLGLSLHKAGRQLGFGTLPLFSQYMVGFYGGLLRKAEERSFEEVTDILQEYRKGHFGLQLGYGYDLYLNENLLLSYGLRGRVDLVNIYSGTDLIPANFRTTRNASLDFTISVKYVLKK